MAFLDWQTFSNLEFSLLEFLQDAINTSNLQLLDETGSLKNVSIVSGKKFNANWELPIIQIFSINKSAPRGFIGNNIRQKEYTVIIDIRGLMEGQQKDLAEWVSDTINNGFTFYEYTKNSSDPDNPNKTDKGLVSIDFVTDTEIPSPEDADIYDKYRWRITIACTLPIC